MQDSTKETRQQFEERYCKFRKVRFGIDYVSLPCNCEDGGGPTHWCAVRLTDDSLTEHMSLMKIWSILPPIIASLTPKQRAEYYKRGGKSQ